MGTSFFNESDDPPSSKKKFFFLHGKSGVGHAVVAEKRNKRRIFGFISGSAAALAAPGTRPLAGEPKVDGCVKSDFV